MELAIKKLLDSHDSTGGMSVLAMEMLVGRPVVSSEANTNRGPNQ